jgi:GH15 family glucan-1,4-alpha-glucosidase
MSGYLPIREYALVGDCHTAALVSRGGSIDWFCPRRFDAPAVFCRILDQHRGGYFAVAPIDSQSATRRYVGPTNVLETVHQTPHGRVRVTDFMPIFKRQEGREGYDVGSHEQVLRLVEALDGDAEVEMAFKPTFDYAKSRVKPTLAEGGAVADGGGFRLVLAAPDAELTADQGAIRGRLRLRAGQRRWLALSVVDTDEQAREALRGLDHEDRLDATLAYWREWAASCTYRGPYGADVRRSALVLKLLMYEPTGAFVAAPTTSLPENPGGERNWDYRFSWLRDASLMLYALTTVGYCEEAVDFFTWLRNTVKRRRPQIMYAVDGRHDLTEIELDHLEGYLGSRPVRLGNGAFDQRQVDIYGEVLNAAHLRYAPSAIGCTRDGDDRGPGQETWALLRRFANHAADEWEDPDRGIWEVRGGPQQFLHSRLMCWVALDRAIHLAKAFSLEGPLDEWERARERVRRAILTRGYDAEQGAFTQAFGSKVLDASALAIPRVGFLPATDPRVRSTVDRIREVLGREGLIYRYRTHETADGVPGGEATFVLCTFWMVDALALGGRIDEARELFERAIGYSNDVGLLAEEVDPTTGELLGNFPQGFSHLSLIQAAVNLAKAAEAGAEDASQDEVERAGPARRAAAQADAAST